VADPGEGEESPWLLQGKDGDPEYDDVELSTLGPRCGQGGSGYFTSVTVRMDPSWPLRSSSCGFWGLSSCGNPTSQEICAHTGALGRPVSRLHSTKEMPNNSKNHKKEFKSSPFTGHRCKFTIRGRLETGKI